MKLSQGKIDVIVKEKYPFALTDEHLVFGQMPRLNQQEIALSPSLAKSFSQNPVDLIGTPILFNGMSYTVSGIFNYTYDNFILSLDAEREFYKSNPEKTPFSITGYVTSMGDIQNLIETYPDVKFETAEAEINTFMSTFARIKNIFTIIAVIVLLASIYTLASVISKLQA